jgi:hypothetical protein
VNDLWSLLTEPRELSLLPLEGKPGTAAGLELRLLMTPSPTPGAGHSVSFLLDNASIRNSRQVFPITDSWALKERKTSVHGMFQRLRGMQWCGWATHSSEWN